MRLGHAPTYLRDADPSCPQVPEFAPIAWRRRRNHLKVGGAPPLVCQGFPSPHDGVAARDPPCHPPPPPHAMQTPASSKSQDDGVYPLPLSEPLASLRVGIWVLGGGVG